jgi:hypothetical protein
MTFTNDQNARLSQEALSTSLLCHFRFTRLCACISSPRILRNDDDNLQLHLLYGERPAWISLRRRLCDRAAGWFSSCGPLGVWLSLCYSPSEVPRLEGVHTVWTGRMKQPSTTCETERVAVAEPRSKSLVLLCRSIASQGSPYSNLRARTAAAHLASFWSDSG